VRYLTAPALCLVSIITAAAAEQTQHARSTASVATRAPVAHEYVDDEATVPENLGATLPHNVATFGYETQLDLMLRRSLTFRKQCARIAAAPDLHVRIAPAIPPRARFDHTLTRLAFKADGSVQADVAIGSRGDPLELLAHEFEHILEQLDGVDLPSMARRASTGVYAVQESVQEGERFETKRALAAGRQVAREVRDGRRRDGQ